MSIKSVTAYANFPVQLKIEKKRYWYIDELVSIKNNTNIVKNLELFQAFNYSFTYYKIDAFRMCPPVITFEGGSLWDYSTYSGGGGVMAPKGKDYYLLNQVFDNMLKKGTPVISENGVYSNISAANNIYTTFNPEDKTWKIVMWVHTPAEGFGDGECLIGPYSTACAAPKLCVDSENHLVLSLASSTGGYDIADEVVSTEMLSLDKNYRITLAFDGQKYTVKTGCNSGSTQIWFENTPIEIESSVPVYGTSNQLGIGYCSGSTAWSGTIDLSEFEIFINDVSVWRPYRLYASFDKGILDLTTDSGAAAEYSVFVKNDGTTELSLNDEDKEGYYWAGKINIPAHSNYVLYQARIYNAGAEEVPIVDNKASDFGINKYLKFDFTLNNEFFDVPYTVLCKFTYSYNSSHQVGMHCNGNGRQLFKIYRGALALNDGADRGLVELTNGKTYWIKGDYVINDGYSLYFIEDNNYTEDTLPDISEWTFVYKTTEPMLCSGEICLGGNIYNQYFCGTFYLEDTSIKSNEVVLWRPFERLL